MTASPRPFQIGPGAAAGHATGAAGSSPWQLAPDTLWQAINPWSWAFTGDQVGLVNISIGATQKPELERTILEEVGSYGRQLGHIGDAMKVLMELVDKTALSEADRDKLEVLEGELAKIRQVKREEQNGLDQR